MSIASITTFGFSSTVNFAVTLGYDQGPAATGKVGGDDAGYRKHLKRQNEILREREAEKLEARQELRRQIDEAVNPPKPIEELTRKEKKQVKAKQAELPDLEINLAILESELRALGTALTLQAIEAKRLRDEDDMEAILLALNAPFQTRH